MKHHVVPADHDGDDFDAVAHEKAGLSLMLQFDVGKETGLFDGAQVGRADRKKVRHDKAVTFTHVGVCVANDLFME